jgi:hypothetical protein
MSGGFRHSRDCERQSGYGADCVCGLSRLEKRVAELEAALREAKAWGMAGFAADDAWRVKPGGDDYPKCVTCGEPNSASLPMAQCRECDIDGPPPQVRALLSSGEGGDETRHCSVESWCCLGPMHDGPCVTAQVQIARETEASGGEE